MARPGLRWAWRTAAAGALLSLASAAAVAEDFAFLPAPPTPEPAEAVLTGLASAGDRLVAVGGRGLIAISDDGEAWRQVTSPVSALLTAVTFVDDKHGWAVGHGGVVLASSDGGLSWKLQLDGRAVNLQFHRWADANVEAREAVLAGLPAGVPGREAAEYALEDARFALEDAETALDTGPVDPFLDVLFLDEHRGYALGAYGLLFRTDDGGGNWRIAIDGLDNPGRYHYYDLHARDGVLYLCGEAGLLFLSRDRGDSWERIEGLYEGSFFGLADLGDGVAAFGLRGNVFVSKTGAQWQRLPLAPGPSLYGGTGLAGGGALLVGAGGSLLRLGADGEARRFDHPARATFSDALLRGGRVYLAGMGGISRLEEAMP
ncbi:WD40/YVTN/BNR-like repeat-containing protein [Pseudohaliea rubra]|uniref:BNR repeat protein n=1 Tax=Pseudohaliea rubra DSM 19751 TaxID=1265313 RepID=A0A095VSE2_9GAMM|nr:YCF48-related protein [Pseudohaliea rubra]KGE04285.1 BNR repeat protein [Pseudohaliea rubra DSM 19751]